MPITKKRLAKVKITLADDVERELLYTLDEVYEMSEMRKTAAPDDPRNFARIVWLGLRHADPDLTVEQVARLIDAPNLAYYNECVAEASFRDSPTQAPPAQIVNGVAQPIGNSSEHSPGFNSASTSGISGN